MAKKHTTDYSDLFLALVLVLGLFLGLVSDLALVLVLGLSLVSDLALVLVLGLFLVLVLVLVLVLGLSSDDFDKFFQYYMAGYAIGAIIAVLLLAIGTVKPTLPANYASNSTQTIDGGSYLINATYNGSSYHCMYVNRATFYTANQTGVHYYPISNKTQLASIASFIGCEGR